MVDALELISKIFYVTICIIIVFANGFAILSILFIKPLRTTPNFLLLSLSFGDFLTGCVAVPFRFSEVYGLEFTLDIDYCRVSHCFTLLNVTGSILNMIAIAIDRYIAIIHPYKYVEIQSSPVPYTAALIGSVWFFILTLTFMPLYAWGSNGAHGPRNKTAGICKFNETLDEDFVWLILVGVEVVGMLLIIYFNIRIYLSIRSLIRRTAPMPANTNKEESEIQTSQVYEHRPVTQLFVQRQSGDSSSRDNSSSSSQIRSSTLSSSGPLNIDMHQLKVFQKQSRKMYLSRWKTAKTMFLIFLVFTSCWIAFIVPTSIFLKCPPCANRTIIMISTIIIYTSSAINPFIYFIRLKSFRKETKAVFRKLCNRFPCCHCTGS